MPKFEVETRPVAFVIEVRGTYTVDCIVGEETPADVIRNFPVAMGTMAAVNQLVTFGEDVEVVIRPDDSRNYPEEMGGYLMPEESPAAVCVECGGYLDHPQGECRS